MMAMTDSANIMGPKYSLACGNIGSEKRRKP